VSWLTLAAREERNRRCARSSEALPPVASEPITLCQIKRIDTAESTAAFLSPTSSLR
jgi:hypothetical protein